jgi:putative MATE family efflux protein
MQSTQKIRLSDHFTYSRLLRFTLSPIMMMIFTSIYGVVDGFFVSNFVGATPFAALNLIMPYIMIFSAVGFMLGSGGSALVAVTLGTGNKKRANEIFSLIIYTVIAVGFVFTIVGNLLVTKVALFLGATQELLPYCVLYARINLLGIPAFMLQNAFQTFLITAEKPRLGLHVTLAAGFTNMILDGLFMGVFHWGLGSAAAATIISQCVGGIIPLVYFLRPNSSRLRLGRTHFMGEVLTKSAGNGSSEFLSNISVSVASMMYNFQLMKYIGQNGVAAYGIIMYTNFAFIGMFFGYSMGASPITGYNLGAANYAELKNVYNKSIRIVSVAGFIMTAASIVLAHPLAMIFAGYDPDLLQLTTKAIRIYSLAYIFMGINIYGSAFFTSMNNGFISALISVLRTLVFQVAAVLIMPALFGIDGIWSSIIIANVLTLIVTVVCFVRYKDAYHYA